MAYYFCISLFGLCFYQDIRYRGIHWLAFPLLFLSALWWQQDVQWINLLYNLAFIGGLMLLLTLYLSLREQRFVAITKGYFSWGDILFLLAVIPLFSPADFMLFFTAGTFVSLIIHALTMLVRKQESVPYAGYMALFTALALSFPEWITSLSSML